MNKEYAQLNQVDSYRIARDTINNLYSTDEGKKFVHHIIYAFNVEEPTPVIFSKVLLYDCLTKSQLKPVSTKDLKITDEISKLFKSYRDAEENSDEKKLYHDEVYSKVSEFIKENQLGRIAYRSNHTNKLLGIDELQALKDFIEDQIKSKNFVILKMMCTLKPDQYKLPKPKTKVKDKKSNKVNKKPKEINNKVVKPLGLAAQSKSNITGALGCDDDIRAKLEAFKSTLSKK